jgi:hypothetical protein
LEGEVKHKTWKRWKHVNDKLDSLMTMVAALVDEGGDRAEAKALAAKVTASAKALQDAIPK